MVESGSIRFKEDVRMVGNGFITVICRLLKVYMRRGHKK